jgi:sugar fermentation stimulation protein A
MAILYKPDPDARAIWTPGVEAWTSAGVYQLWIRVRRACRIQVGRLGRLSFPTGLYVYTGRAARGLPARVARHARGARAKHWHVDYLLGTAGVSLEKVVLVSQDPRTECMMNRAVGAGAVSPVLGFGASDCRRKCPAHLWLISAGPRRRDSLGEETPMR